VYVCGSEATPSFAHDTLEGAMKRVHDTMSLDERQIVPMPRHPRQIYGELLAARKEVEVLREEMGKFAALDFRPILFTEGHIEKIGELQIPEALVEMYRAAFQRMTELEFELVQAEELYRGESPQWRADNGKMYLIRGLTIDAEDEDA